MTRYMLILAAVSSFCISALSGKVLVPFLHRLHFGQSIRESGPTWHAQKSGTPTMGGLCFIVGSTLAVGLSFGILLVTMPQLFGTAQDMNVMLCMGAAFAYGAVGFVDDYIKVVKKRNLGLHASAKLVAQVMITVAFLAGLKLCGMLTTIIALPGAGSLDLGLLYYPIAFFGIIYLVNAVNLTDGVDGLASSVTFVVELGYLVLTSYLGFYHLSLYAAALAGGIAGFLIWNFHPAKVFMGDTGSMFLGGAVTCMAFCMARPELVLFLGVVYLWEATTVVIQRVYYKVTHGKRIFKMTPIHHSFEMSGYSEEKICGLFSFIALAGVLLAFVFMRLS